MDVIKPTIERRNHQQKVMEKEKVKKEVVVKEEEEKYGDEYKKNKGVLSNGCWKKGSGGGFNGMMRGCQAEKCSNDLSDAKQYYKRHKVCDYHSKAQVVLVAGIRQRFCQQCSRFHELSEFDEAKRSCRRRLAGHNERRRKNSGELNPEGSSRKGTTGTELKDVVCGQQVDDQGRIQITIIQENATYNHLQIR